MCPGRSRDRWALRAVAADLRVAPERGERLACGAVGPDVLRRQTLAVAFVEADSVPAPFCPGVAADERGRIGVEPMPLQIGVINLCGCEPLPAGPRCGPLPRSPCTIT